LHCLVVLAPLLGRLVFVDLDVDFDAQTWTLTLTANPRSKKSSNFAEQFADNCLYAVLHRQGQGLGVKVNVHVKSQRQR
jgi:hypothetical protein